jgi:hypothetical protein
MRMTKLLFLPLVMVASVANAGAYWTALLSNWNLYLDNGVAYVDASNMPAHCSNSRAQIETSSQIYSASYQRDIYAYVLAAHAAGKTLRIVVNDQESLCKVYGANVSP